MKVLKMHTDGLGTRTLHYSPGLARVVDRLPDGYHYAGDFYDAVKAVCCMENGVSLTDSDEEHHIYLQESRGAGSLREAEALGDYLCAGGWYAFGVTRTALRFSRADLMKPYQTGDEIPVEIIVTEIPEDVRRQIADPKFTRDNFRDVVGRINRKVAERTIKYARGEVIAEVDRLGIWTEIMPGTAHEEPYALHAWLREGLSISKDPISGEYDVVVGRRHRTHRMYPNKKCLSIDATSRRTHSELWVGFRPVIRSV